MTRRNEQDGFIAIRAIRGPFLIGKAPPGFEPGMADLQSAALPLGEGADLAQGLHFREAPKARKQI
jgi:hypothetical protein